MKHRRRRSEVTKGNGGMSVSEVRNTRPEGSEATVGMHPNK